MIHAARSGRLADGSRSADIGRAQANPRSRTAAAMIATAVSGGGSAALANATGRKVARARRDTTAALIHWLLPAAGPALRR
jgi:hypothetical protein